MPFLPLRCRSHLQLGFAHASEIVDTGIWRRMLWRMHWCSGILAGPCQLPLRNAIINSSDEFFNWIFSTRSSCVLTLGWAFPSSAKWLTNFNRITYQCWGWYVFLIKLERNNIRFQPFALISYPSIFILNLADIRVNSHSTTDFPTSPCARSPGRWRSHWYPPNRCRRVEIICPTAELEFACYCLREPQIRNWILKNHCTFHLQMTASAPGLGMYNCVGALISGALMSTL